MDDQDKIYLWMVIATFVALAVGCLFEMLQQNDLANTVVQNLTF